MKNPKSQAPNPKQIPSPKEKCEVRNSRWRFIVMGIFLLGFCISPMGCDSGFERPDVDLYDIAKDWFRAQDFDRAIQMCDKAIAMKSHVGEAWLLMGICYAKKSHPALVLGNKQEADTNYVKALEAMARAWQYSKSSEVMYHYGILLYDRATVWTPIVPEQERKWARDEAIVKFREAIRLDPEKSYMARRYLGTLLAARGEKPDLEEARQQYDRFLAIARQSLAVKQYEYRNLIAQRDETTKEIATKEIENLEAEILAVDELVKDINAQIKPPE